ncbi:hypothetical protein [Pseudomonas sp. BF-B-26]|jgi:hypothetical protein|uniref:hypothetical protein n=1 Tax=Pseudomonas sp. BF-B-26 TaxID=2832400 RepID=UPI001CBCB859|nr:hypothetical protein [Pseudomonas sp. BF-B-26]
METLAFSDGTILGVMGRQGEVVVEFVDWQERCWSVLFRGAIAYKSISSEGEEISDLLELSETDFSKEVELVDGDKGTSYCFVSAWSDDVVLTIVAEGYVAKLSIG